MIKPGSVWAFLCVLRARASRMPASVRGSLRDCLRCSVDPGTRRKLARSGLRTAPLSTRLALRRSAPHRRRHAASTGTSLHLQRSNACGTRSQGDPVCAAEARSDERIRAGGCLSRAAASFRPTPLGASTAGQSRSDLRTRGRRAGAAGEKRGRMEGNQPCASRIFRSSASACGPVPCRVYRRMRPCGSKMKLPAEWSSV